METKKQEAIKLAWGVHFAHDIDENGFRVYTEFEKHNLNQWVGDYWEKGFNEITNKYWVRPKSLSGLENNRGWISILSEDDLPKESGKYFIVTNGKIQVGAYILNYKRWFADGCYYSDTYQNLGITHYQSVIKPNLPIF